ncbi:MAG: hypothetical protein DRO04_03140, partial [Candidatus Iainarchaeum archaeon]
MHKRLLALFPFLFLLSLAFAQLSNYGIFIYEDSYGYYVLEYESGYYWIDFYPNIVTVEYFPEYQIVYYEDYYFIPSYGIYLYPLPDGYYPYGIPDYVGFPSDAYANISGSAGTVSIQKTVKEPMHEEQKNPEFKYTFKKRPEYYGFENVNEKVEPQAYMQKTYSAEVVPYEIMQEENDASQQTEQQANFLAENSCNDILLTYENSYLTKTNPKLKMKIVNSSDALFYVQSVYLNSNDADFYISERNFQVMPYATKELFAELKSLRNNTINAEVTVLGNFYNGKTCTIQKQISLYAEDLEKYYSCKDISIELPNSLNAGENYFYFKMSNPTERTITVEFFGDGITTNLSKIDVEPHTYVEKKIVYTLGKNPKSIR